MPDPRHLVTFADITARTVVELGSNAHKFAVAIPRAETKHLRPVLGPVLFAELLAFIQPTAAPNPADPLAVLAEEVKQMLSDWSVVVAWPSLLGHIEAAGFTTKVGDKTSGTTTADVQLTDRTLANLRESALGSSAELTRWLIEHQADYPTWQAPGGLPSTQMPLGGLQLD